MPKQKKQPEQPDKNRSQTPHESPKREPSGQARAQADAVSAQEQADFPIVGIGASAGGLEALEQLFTHLPPDGGMAFVVIVHLAPDHQSMMSNILQKYTDMPVVEIKDGVQIEENSVYVIAPDANVGILHGTLQLLEPDMPRGRRAPVDYFFRSLADDQAERAIAIVLSGTGSNGSLGLKAIKGAGGMIMVQAPESAKYEGMPHSAIATGLADYVLPPPEMPAHLIEYIKDFKVKMVSKPITRTPQNRDAMQKVILLLRSYTGHDFSDYKPSTIERRLSRRMAVHQFETLSDYVRYLTKEQAEIETLFKELLIGVTNFFRDPEAFEVLKEKVLPHLLENKLPDQPLRIWVAGCSSGEEAYSIAIVIKEYLTEHKLNVRSQIFASDIDAEAIDFARLGTYPDGIVVDVSPERLNRFFTQENNSYRINGDIREMVIFAAQSVIKDAPFSRLDLASCRNLLIYLQAEMQQKILNLFYYSLKKDGILFLGTSETRAEANGQQFAIFDNKWKFFRRVGEATSHHYMTEFPFGRDTALTVAPTAIEEISYRRKPVELAKSPRNLAEKLLLANYVPAAAIVDEQGTIIYIHGQTSPYLMPPTGDLPFNILNMARDNLHLQLRTGIYKAVRQRETVVYEQLRIKSEGQERHLNLTIRPLFKNRAEPDWAIVIFESAPSPARAGLLPTGESPASADKLRVAELEQDLAATKAYLQTTVEELETANEDVRAANEELQAANEELQSMNEELQTSQEELRSSNEELMTINTDYQNKIDSLREGHDDVKNLLINSQLAILFLDLELRIKHFTPLVTEIVRLISSDVGRPLADLTIRLDYDHLAEDAEQVLQTLASKEVETRSHEGSWYKVRILPYRSVDNVIGGVVITFVDITLLKALEAQQQREVDYLRSILATVREPLIVLTSELRIVSANQFFYKTFQVDSQETEGQLIYNVGNGQWDIPQLRRLLEQIIPRNNSFEDFEVEHDFPVVGRRLMRLNARRLNQLEGRPELILLAIEDVTEQEQLRGKI